MHPDAMWAIPDLVSSRRERGVYVLRPFVKHKLVARLADRGYNVMIISDHSWASSSVVSGRDFLRSAADSVDVVVFDFYSDLAYSVYNDDDKKSSDPFVICITIQLPAKQIEGFNVIPDTCSPYACKRLTNLILEPSSCSTAAEELECGVCYKDRTNSLTRCCRQPLCDLCVRRWTKRTCPFCVRDTVCLVSAAVVPPAASSKIICFCVGRPSGKHCVKAYFDEAVYRASDPVEDQKIQVLYYDSLESFFESTPMYKLRFSHVSRHILLTSSRGHGPAETEEEGYAKSP